jgi:hypothetical protein
MQNKNDIFHSLVFVCKFAERPYCIPKPTPDHVDDLEGIMASRERESRAYAAFISITAFIAAGRTGQGEFRRRLGRTSGTQEKIKVGKMSFCTACEAKLPVDATYCNECGAEVSMTDDRPFGQTEARSGVAAPQAPGPQTGYAQPASATAQNDTEAQIYRLEDARVFVGKNWEYYSRKWEAMHSGNRRMSWNWPAFFLPVFWLAYRKMYWQACLFSVVAVVLDMIHVPAMGGIKLLYFISFAAFANHVYRQHVSAKLKQIRETNSPEQAQLELQRQGGTNAWAAIGVLVIIVLLILLRMRI